MGAFVGRMVLCMAEKNRVIPAGREVAARLEQELKQGRYAVDSLLPTEEETAARFGVSRYAVSQAYGELARRGLVRRVRRLGTKVIYDPAAVVVHKFGLVMVANVPAYSLFHQGVEEVVGDHGIELSVRYHYWKNALDEAAVADAIDHGAQGLIVTSSLADSRRRYRELADKGFPLVLAMASDPDLHSVFPNDHKAGMLVGEHFGRQGFRSPAVVCGDQDYARIRVYGFREGMAFHGIRLGDDRTVQATYRNEDGEPLPNVGRSEAEKLMALDPRPDCVFVINDSLAISVYYWLLKAGLRVPEDIALAGVDNLGPRYHPFQLTSVDIGLARAGRESAELLMSLIERPQTKTVHRQIEPELVVSASTQR